MAAAPPAPAPPAPARAVRALPQGPRGGRSNARAPWQTTTEAAALPGDKKPIQPLSIRSETMQAKANSRRPYVLTGRCEEQCHVGQPCADLPAPLRRLVEQREERERRGAAEHEEEPAGQRSALRAAAVRQRQDEWREGHRRHQDGLLVNVPREHEEAEPGVDEAGREASLARNAPQLAQRRQQRQGDQRCRPPRRHRRQQAVCVGVVHQAAREGGAAAGGRRQRHERRQRSRGAPVPAMRTPMTQRFGATEPGSPSPSREAMAVAAYSAVPSLSARL